MAVGEALAHGSEALVERDELRVPRGSCGCVGQSGGSPCVCC